MPAGAGQNGVRAARAAAPASNTEALGRLRPAVDAIEKGDAAGALQHLAAAQGRLPLLADYVAFYTGQARSQAKDYASVGAALEPVFKHTPGSPLAGRAALLAARALIELENFRGALAALGRVAAEQLPQPQGMLLQAKALEGAGDAVAAAAQFQSVFYLYPLSEESGDARAALARLERSLGDRYPTVMPQARLDRAQRLLDAREAARAKAELLAMVDELGGAELEVARVRIGAAEFQLKRTDQAIAHLRAFECRSQAAEAERLYHLAACYRRLDRVEPLLEQVEALQRVAPDSPWRLKALILAGNSFLVDNEQTRYMPLYAACADSFPQSDEAAGCHWKSIWPVYLARRPEAEALLKEHLKRWPDSDKAGAALYYLGRLCERANDLGGARRYYHELVTRFPNYFYTYTARQRLAQPDLGRAVFSSAVETFLKGVAWPVRLRQADVAPDAATAQRLDRARLLDRAGLEAQAEIELRFGLKHGAKLFPSVMEMAEIAYRRGAYDQALRYVKGNVPNYLWIPSDGAPARFWKQAFPFPYRAKIERYAKRQGVDPYLVAALIRQESEFNATVVSYAKAIGLMQVLPGTGRELGRRLGLKQRVLPASLKQPDVNLAVGTYYLRQQLDARNGSVEETLAGYNAGPNRIPVWRGWGEFREPGEFVETIPFAQTREYVQIVMRNAEMYRWIYAGEPVPVEEAAAPEEEEKPAAKKAATNAPGKKSAAKKAGAARSKTTTKGKSRASKQ